MNTADYYELLGVSPWSSEAEIRSAYRKLAFKHHPDRNPDNPKAEAIFKEISRAYDCLMDPRQRGDYDRRRARTAPRPQVAPSDFGPRYVPPEMAEEVFAAVFRRRRKKKNRYRWGGVEAGQSVPIAPWAQMPAGSVPIVGGQVDLGATYAVNKSAQEAMLSGRPVPIRPGQSVPISGMPHVPVFTPQPKRKRR